MQHEADLPAAQAPPLPLREPRPVQLADPQAGRLDLRALAGEPDQGPGRHGLAGAGFADDGGARSPPEREADPAHGLHGPLAGAEGDPQAGNLNDQVAAGHCASRRSMSRCSAWPATVMAITVTVIAAPGNTPVHQATER